MDILAHNTTKPMGQQGLQSRITSDRAYMPNSQVNSFLSVHTYSSQNWMLLNYVDGFIFRNMSEEPIKCKGASSKFKPGGRSDNSQLGPARSKIGPAFRTTHSDLQEARD
jgi:hypothetical protein